MRMRPALVALVAAALLSGCASSPKADLNTALADVTNTANAKDAPGLRGALDRLGAVVNRQSAADLPLDKAQRIRALVEKLRVDAALLDAPPTPTPTPTPTRTPTRTASPSASPSETPTPSPTQSRTPSPTPTPTAPPTASPTPTATPTPTVSPAAAGDVVSPSGSVSIGPLSG